LPEALAHGYAALKSSTGASRTGQKVTVESIRAFHASKDMVVKAAAALKELGFTVRSQGPLGIAIAGRPELFQKAFAARLTEKVYDPFPKPVVVRGQRLTARHFITERPLAVPANLGTLIDRVRMAPAIRWFATPDAPAIGYFHLDVPEDIARLIDAHSAADHGINGAGVRLCVIDSGFHAHEWYAAHGFAITLVNAGADVDDYGHGTGITTNAMSVAPGAQFFGVQLNDGAGSFQDARTINPNVITCSWGMWGYDADLHDEIVDAVAHNITVCFACGNGAGGAAWPGSMNEVVSVGGTYIDEHGDMQASDYASSGTNPGEPGRQCPDVCGLTGMMPHGIYIAMPTQDGSTCDDIFSADGDGTAVDDGWIVASGTSSASPAVAGVAALILQANPGFTPAQVKTALQQCCRDVITGSSANGDAAGPGFDNATGWGLVDGFIAVHPVDIWCMDCADDNGCVPNTYEHAWTSPDVWVTGVLGGPTIGNPEHGQANYVYVRVRNRGTAAANGVQVHLYWSDPCTAIAWPADWHTDGIKVDGVPGNTRPIVSIPAGGEATTDAFEWWPPDPTTSLDPTNPGHFCLLVRVECADDPITHEGNVRNDNNITMKNTTVIDLLPDMEFTFKILVGMMPKVDGRATLVVNRTAVPRTVKLEFAQAPVTGLRRGLEAVRPGVIEPMMAAAVKPVLIAEPVVTQPLTLTPNRKQVVGIKVTVPKKAKAGETYVVYVDQNIGRTNVGHVTLIARVVDKARLVGDRGALVVHKWGCPDIANIKKENKLLINTTKAAKAMKFKPCAKCQPK
jgi:hypothetical protein